MQGQQPVLIVLAAGRGSRFQSAQGDDEHKLSQHLGSETVLALTLRHALSTQLPVVVVTTERLAEAARHSIAARDVIVLPEVGSAASSGLGMGYSIAAGVSARPHANGWLVLPGDMPLVRSDTLCQVARALDQYAVAYAQYKGHRGHPVGFSPELYSELIMLNGDEGARRVVARYPAMGVEVDDPGVLVDIDTLADLEKVRLAQERQMQQAQQVHGEVLAQRL